MNGRSLPLRRTGWLLLALALLARAWLPQGFMPVAARDGIRVAICSGSGPAFVVLGRDGKFHQEEPEQKRTPCPFALAAASADLPPLPALPAPPIAAQAPAPQGLIAARLAAWRALRPPARGPPATA